MKRIVAPPTRRIPPVLTAWLVAIWLLLNETLALGQIVLGVVLAVAVAWATSSLRPLQPRIRRSHLVLVLLARAFRDIVRSNIGVGRIVLGLVRRREVQSGFVKIPLELTDPHGLAMLAGIVTATPGTVWVDFDVATRTATLHVLDLRDEREWIEWIKGRYEPLLLRMLQ